jgi:hypothetical protein
MCTTRPSTISPDCALRRARGWRDDIAAQDAEPLPCLNHFFVRKRLHKFAVIVFAEFTKNRLGWTLEFSGWSGRGRRQNSTAVLGTGLFLSTSHHTRILFSTPEAVTRFKEQERNRQQQDDRE